MPERHTAPQQVLGQPELVEKIVAPLDSVAPVAVSRSFQQAYESKALWQGLAERKRPHARPLRSDAAVPELRAWVGAMHKVDQALDLEHEGMHAFQPMRPDEHAGLTVRGAAATQGYVAAYLVEPQGHPVWSGPTRPDAEVVQVQEGHATVQLAGGRTTRLPVDPTGTAAPISTVVALPSPDQRTVALNRGDQLLLFDVATEPAQLLHHELMEPEAFQGKAEKLGPMGWFADGKRLAFMSFTGADATDLRVADLSGPQLHTRRLHLGMRYHSASMMAPAPHGGRLAVVTDRAVAIYDLASSRPEEAIGELVCPPTAGLECGAPEAVAWSPDGQYLARLMPGSTEPFFAAEHLPVAPQPAEDFVASFFADLGGEGLFAPASPADAAPPPPLPSRVDVWRVADEAWPRTDDLDRPVGLQPKSFPVPAEPRSVLAFHPNSTRIVVQQPHESFVLDLNP